MSAARNSKIVSKQVNKSKMVWSNLDEYWISLYIHLNRGLCTDKKHIEKLLPCRRKGRRGKEAGGEGEEDKGE